MMAEDAESVAAAIATACLPPVILPHSEPIRPFDRFAGSIALNHDLSTLVSLRSEHETKRAKAAVRKRFLLGSGDEERPPSTAAETSRKQTAQQALIQGMQQVVRQEQERAIGTGLERDARQWKGHYGKKDTATGTQQMLRSLQAQGHL